MSCIFYQTKYQIYILKFRYTSLLNLFCKQIFEFIIKVGYKVSGTISILSNLLMLYFYNSFLNANMSV